MPLILKLLSKNSVSQVNVRKQQFCISCLRKKKAIAGLWPGIIQQPVNALAGSRRIGMKTARPGVDYSSH